MGIDEVLLRTYPAGAWGMEGSLHRGKCRKAAIVRFDRVYIKVCSQAWANTFKLGNNMTVHRPSRPMKDLLVEACTMSFRQLAAAPA